MQVFNAPQYVIETLVAELDRQKVDRGFVNSVSFFDTVYHRESGEMSPIIKGGKILGVDLSIWESKYKERECKKHIFHEVHHTKKIFQEGFGYYGNAECNEILASLYENRRALEERLKSACRRLVGTNK
jgi:hypothetical protein